MKKTIVRIVCFLLILGCVLGGANQILKFKYADGIYGMTWFYKQDRDTVDVLVLGSSHAFAHFDVATLWEEYGMATYVLGSASQPMWNTYYNLKEALEYQTPQIIVLDVYSLYYDTDYAEPGYIVKSLYGMRWGKNKIKSLLASVPEDEITDYAVEYARYHSRYEELSYQDFLPNKGGGADTMSKGFVLNTNTESFENPVIERDGTVPTLGEKSETYCRMIIELAKENNIPIVLVDSPWPAYSIYDQYLSNAASNLAYEYAIDYIDTNFCLDEMGIDYTTDASDAGHLNYRGAPKFAKYIGAWLKERYDISDRRGDERYSSWDEYSELMDRVSNNQYIRDSKSFEELMGYVQDRGYNLIVRTKGICDTSDSNLQSYFDAMDLDPQGEDGIWYLSDGNMIWQCTGEDTGSYYIEETLADVSMTRAADESYTGYTNTIVYNNATQTLVDNGLDVSIYDPKLKTVVASFSIDPYAEYAFTIQ